MASGLETKTGDYRIYVVSIMLFSCIVVGGAFLALYIHHPESESNSWYPTAGMVLVGIPWIFWILTFFYAWLKKLVAESLARNNNNNNHNHNNNNNNNKIAPENVNARTSGASSTTSASTDSPGGGGGGGVGHVRFGAAMVMGEGDDKDDIVGSNSDAHSDIDQERRDGGPLHINGATGRSSNNGDGSNSSLGSHESELPLTYSMS